MDINNITNQEILLTLTKTYLYSSPPPKKK